MSLVEEAIHAKGGIATRYALTIRDDASAILESLVAGLSPADLDRALELQGYKLSPAYHTTLRALSAEFADRVTR